MFGYIKEYNSPSRQIFLETIKPLAEPAILRNICEEWPLIKKGKEGPESLFKYLKKNDNGRPLQSLIAPPEVEGKFFYSDDFRSRNFGVVEQTLSEALSVLESEVGQTFSPARYVQSIYLKDHAPAIGAQNKLPFFDNIAPRFWIGGKTTAQTHFDFDENLAIVILGRRTVTLFPPEQLQNLYIGPLESAPGGVFVSTASLDKPDFKKHPKFKTALDTALQAELGIGDAVYIPCGWWHHIKAEAPLNMLLNYWWQEGEVGQENPQAALLHAIMTFENMAESERVIWKNIFEAIVFRISEDDPMGHLPQNSRGVLGGIGKKNRRRALLELLSVLGPQVGLHLPPIK